MSEDSGSWKTAPIRTKRRNPPPPSTRAKSSLGIPQHQEECHPIVGENHCDGSDSVSLVLEEPYMIMLMGLPGSGKSTIAMQLEQMQPYKFVRINQDELGSRGACLEKARKALRKEQHRRRNCVIIDRCNINEQQRIPFLSLAQEMGDIPVDLIILNHVSKETCLHRCQQRIDHPTLPCRSASSTSETSMIRRVISYMHKDWTLPCENELRHIRRVVVINNQDDLQLWIQMELGMPTQSTLDVNSTGARRYMTS